MIDDEMEDGGIVDEPVEVAEPVEAEALPSSLKKLLGYIEATNIADSLTEEVLQKVGDSVWNDYEIDRGSCSRWHEVNKKAMDLACQISKDKSFPWEKAANVIIPLIAQAAISYNARTYPEIIQNGGVCKSRVLGKDMDGAKAERAKRVQQHMDYQLLFEMPEWEEDTDRLLLMYSVVGTMFRKVYYDPIERRNATTLLMPDAVVVNNGIRSIDKARRISHLFTLFGNEIESQKRAKLFLDVELSEDKLADDQGNEQPEDDPAHYFIEQHRWLDLDDDGLEEPYIVTIHRDSRKVVRIVARFDERDVMHEDDKVIAVKARNHFVAYHFVHSFDGSFLSYGFGALLYQLSRAANSTINALLNAGTLSNVQSGFLAKNFRMSGGNKPFAPGEWKKTDLDGETLQKSLLPMPVKEPSQTLMALLDKLIEMANGLVQVANIDLSTMPANAAATATLSVLEQQGKVFSAVFKRFYRSLGQELRLHYDMNSRYMDDDQTIRLSDAEIIVGRADYDHESMDIIPVADPSITSQAQRMASARIIYDTAREVPGSNIVEAARRFLNAAGQGDIDQIIPPSGEQTIPPEIQQAMQGMQQQLQQAQATVGQISQELIAARQLLLNKSDDNKVKMFAAIHDAQLKEAQAIKYLAEAEKTESGTQIERLRAVVESMANHRQSLEAMTNVGTVEHASGAGMAQPPRYDLIPNAPAIGGGGAGQPAGNQPSAVDAG